MEDPAAEITQVIHLLTQSPPSLQKLTLERYFTRDASFTHPFCRTGSFNFDPQFSLGPLGPASRYTCSRWLILCIYRWYKILSPKIELNVDSVAYDSNSMTLYVSLHQLFHIFLLPQIFASKVNLVTVLKLTPITSYDHSAHSEVQHTKYLISSQNDLYQVDEFLKFFDLSRVLWSGIYVWHFISTLACVIGQLVGYPISWWEEGRPGRNLESRRQIERRESEAEVEKVD